MAVGELVLSVAPCGRQEVPCAQVSRAQVSGKIGVVVNTLPEGNSQADQLSFGYLNCMVQDSRVFFCFLFVWGGAIVCFCFLALIGHFGSVRLYTYRDKQYGFEIEETCV